MTLEEAYEILGINYSSEYDEIIEEYRAKAKLYHPDLNQSSDATLKMQQINEAFEIIKTNYGKKDYPHSSKKQGECQNTRNESKSKEEDIQQFENDNQTNDVLYKVVLHAGKSCFIPYFCPVCLKRTNNIIIKSFSFIDSEFISYRRYKIKQYKSSISFFCCCNSRFNKYVKIIHKSNGINFYFKNKEYAELFAEINHEECILSSRVEQIIDKILHITMFVLLKPGLRFLAVVICFFLYIMFDVVFS